MGGLVLFHQPIITTVHTHALWQQPFAYLVRFLFIHQPTVQVNLFNESHPHEFSEDVAAQG